MILLLLDESLRLQVFYEDQDCDYRDNICISIREDCPQNEKIFIHDETNIFITPRQAEELAAILTEAALKSRASNKD